MTDERLAEIENRLSNSTSEQILEREDYDYYQCGIYLGTKPYCYIDGKQIDGLQPNGEIEYFHNDIFKVEGSEGDKLLFINAHKDITDLITALRADRDKLKERQVYCDITRKEKISLFNQLEAERANVDKLQEKYRWISINDKLPLKDSIVDVLINGSSRMMNTIYSDNQKKYLWTDEYEELTWRDIESTGEKITHWMYPIEIPTGGK